jgi:type I restriction enzyme, S subunit
LTAPAAARVCDGAPEQKQAARPVSFIDSRRPRNRDGCQYFTLYQLKDRFSEEDSMGGGTIFKAVTKDDVHGIEFVTPDEDLLRVFESHACVLVREICNLTQKNCNLRATRDLLLTKLISGEIDVSELDIAVQEATG